MIRRLWSHAIDKATRALDAAWGRVDTRYANALNGPEDEL